MDGHVRELALRVHSAPAPDVAPRAERFARRVLERVDALLERNAPGRVVVIDELAMEWRLRLDALGDEAEVEAVAREIAAALEGELSGAVAERAVARLAAFSDEACWCAEYLRALGAGEADWRYKRLAAREVDAFGILCAEPERLSRELLRLRRDGRLGDALRGAGAEGRRRLAAALGEGEVGAADADPGGGTKLDEVARAAKALGFAGDLDAAGTHVWAYTEARARWSGRDEPFWRGVARAASARAAPGPVRAVGSETPARRSSGTGGDGELAASEKTAFAGLFYLVRPIVELGIASLLYEAGLDERAVLARSAVALAGADADPAPWRFGGTRRLPQPFDDGVLDSVGPAMLRSLLEALPRWSLAALPDCVARAARVGGARALVLTPLAGDLPLFVWPAESPARAEAGLEMLLSIWPRSAPIHAAPGLCELDRAARLRPLRAPAIAGPRLEVSGAPAALQGLCAQVAGIAAFLVCARSGAAGPDVASVREGFLRVPGEIVDAEGSLVVRVSADHVNLALRRSGSDADPGFVPWLDKAVRFDFHGGDEA